nr:YbjN domain-containing protein [Sandaracinobacteroides sayramensis]
MTAADPSRIAAWLQQIGYRPELTTDQTGDPRIVVGFAGVPASLWFNDCDEDGGGCDSIRLQVGLLTDRKLSLAAVNAFNNQWRFGTLSLDEEQDPLLNYDLWLSKPGMPAGLLARNVRQFEALVRELRDMVNAHEGR